MTTRRTGCGEAIATIPGFGERVGPEAQSNPGVDDLGDDGFVVPLVEVVHQLGALVAEITGVFKTGRTFHGAQSSRRPTAPPERRTMFSETQPMGAR